MDRRNPVVARCASLHLLAISHTRWRARGLLNKMPGGSHDAPGSPGEGSLSYTRVRAVSAALLQDGSMYGLAAWQADSAAEFRGAGMGSCSPLGCPPRRSHRR